MRYDPFRDVLLEHQPHPSAKFSWIVSLGDRVLLMTRDEADAVANARQLGVTHRRRVWKRAPGAPDDLLLDGADPPPSA